MRRGTEVNFSYGDKRKAVWLYHGMRQESQVGVSDRNSVIIGLNGGCELHFSHDRVRINASELDLGLGISREKGKRPELRGPVSKYNNKIVHRKWP